MSLILEGRHLFSLSELDSKTSFDKIVHLDVSNNSLRSGQELAKFKVLKILIIDNNGFDSLADFPRIDSLVTFSSNKNKFTNLVDFCTELPEKFPNLLDISLLKNDLCPFFAADEFEYAKYRKCLLLALPGLKNIDGENVVPEKSSQKSEKKIEDEKYEDIEGFEENEQVFRGTIEYNEKYKYKNPSKNIKTKSEGNRFLKNEQL